MSEFVSIARDDLSNILNENRRLSKQVTELQARMTEMVEERREIAERCHRLETAVQAAQERPGLWVSG